MVEEAEQTGNSISAVARKYEVSPNQVFHWRKLMRAGALVAAGAEDAVVPLSEARALQMKIRELERLLGKKTMEVEILKDALECAREKNCSCPAGHPGRTLPGEAHRGSVGGEPLAGVCGDGGQAQESVSEGRG